MMLLEKKECNRDYLNEKKDCNRDILVKKRGNTSQGHGQEFVKGGGLNFFFQEGGSALMGPEK